jgi:hypothetical protein
VITQPNKAKKLAKPAPAQAPASPIGVIDTRAIYSLSTFKRILGAGDWALRMMRRDGLKVIQVGNLRFVRGADFSEFLAAAGEQGGGDPA